MVVKPQGASAMSFALKSIATAAGFLVFSTNATAAPTARIEATRDKGLAVLPPEKEISYVHRWNVTEPYTKEPISPPWKLLWSRSPIWFERLNPGGKNESPNRRIAVTPEGIVTVMKRTLYLMSLENGRTIWSFPLEGEEITDWKTMGDVVAFAAIDWKQNKYFRYSFNLKSRKMSLEDGC